MNIFVVDVDPVVAAQSLHDRHVVKMVLETAQILCTVAHGKGLAAPYKPTHAAHPCTVWAGESAGNVDWLMRHGLALCDEYTYRYGKTHASREVIDVMGQALLRVMAGGAAGRQTPFAVAVAEDSVRDDAVESYRTTYRKHKLPGSRYTRRKPPVWADGCAVTYIPTAKKRGTNG